ncbi:MAG: ABC transporter ATP-binding protein [Clostridiales bacterium]|nr:ABC transporter ATP-binding protein [Clostridiales bacterium]
MTQAVQAEKGGLVISVKDLKKVYAIGDERTIALNGVNLEVERGEVVCIVGRSGSGKSTLLNMLAGLEKPTSGQVIVAGKHIEKLSEGALVKFRLAHVGFIFQAYDLFPYYTAVENVAVPLIYRGVPKKKRNKMAEKLLCEMGLKDHLKHKPTQMSGGQQQRVGIARALVAKPDIIFADEPTGNLDSNTSDEVLRLMIKMVKDNNFTLVMVTHDPTVAKCADRVISILDGKIISDTKYDTNSALQEEKENEQV